MKRLFSIMLCIILICGMPAMPAQASESVTPSGVALEDVDREIELMAKKNKDIYDFLVPKRDKVNNLKSNLKRLLLH